MGVCTLYTDLLGCRAYALLAYLEVEVPRLLGKAQAGLFSRMRGVVKFQSEPSAQQVKRCCAACPCGASCAPVCAIQLRAVKGQCGSCGAV